MRWRSTCSSTRSPASWSSPRTSLAPSTPTRLHAAAYDRLAYTHKRVHVLAIEGAKKTETRERRIEKAVEMLRGACV